MKVDVQTNWWEIYLRSPWLRNRILSILKDKFETLPSNRQHDYQIRMVDKSGTTIYNKGYGDKWEYSYAFEHSRIPLGNIETCTFEGEHSEKIHHYLQRMLG